MKNIHLEWLENPEVFSVNRVEHHSDHKYFKNMDESLEGSTSFKTSLNGDWHFHYANNLDGILPNFYSADYNVSGWDKIKVPGHIQLQGYDRPHYVNTMYPWDGQEDIMPPHVPKVYNPVGSYVKDIEIPSDWNKESVYISFQGVETAFYLWLNGEFVGYSEDSFTPSEFDLSPYVKEGKNRLAVMVVKYSSASWLEDQDFWRFSGIFRDVYLYTVPKTHVRDMFVRTDLVNDYKDSDLEIDFDLQGKLDCNINLTLKDREGNVALTDSINVNDNKFTATNHLKDVKLWSAEEPNLYDLLIEVVDQTTNETLEIITQKVGFRKFEMIDKIMHINGKRIVFRGVNRHEFSCHTGRYVSKEEMLWDVKNIKQNNMNAVRTSHYPNNSYFYDLCDEYGLYLIDEANLESHGTWQKMGAVKPDYNVPESRPEWMGCCLDRAKAMLERDKNHPSILIWSCGNESYAGEVIYQMSEYYRNRDNTRYVHYEGVFHNREFDATSDMESRMYATVAMIEEYLNDNPQKPFVSCEYTHAMGNSNGAMHKYIELEDKYPMYQGGFIWDYIDQGLMAKDMHGKDYIAFGGDFGDRPTDYNFCINGIVYADRRESPKMQEVKYNYQNFKISVGENSTTIFNNNLFVGTNDLQLSYSLLRDGKKVQEGLLNIEIPAKEEATINLPVENRNIPGEYVVNVALVLKDDTLWAKKGHEVAYGQHIYTVEQSSDADTNSQKSIIVSDCDVNFGVRGENFQVIFARNYGGLVSYKYNGKEFIDSIPKPNFWHALTDNDRGNQAGFRCAQWKMASLYLSIANIETSYDSTKATIVYTYQLPTVPATTCKLGYTITGDGSVSVTMDYKGVEGLPEMMDFGVIFKVPAVYENLQWYGLGKEENYTDRCKGARLGIYSNKVKDNLSQYVIPQECGNKTGVRWARVTNNQGNGLEISGNNLEFSALPFTPHELENADHHYDLPEIHHTVIRVSKKHTGIAGDDSWGSLAHEEYLIPSNEDISFTFSFKGI